MLLNYQQLAEHLQLSVPTVERYVREGVIPCIKLRQAVRFDLEDVTAALKQRHERLTSGSASSTDSNAGQPPTAS